jgi:hypothetical protein
MRWELERRNLGGKMLKFNEILIVFCTLIGFGLAGAPLKMFESAMGNLAVDVTKHGYMSLSDFNTMLTAHP